MPLLGLIRILSRKLTSPLRDLSSLQREVAAASVNIACTALVNVNCTVSVKVHRP